ncbi:MAG: LacI family DNA-binding transcriptional regulator [Cohaesibacter sp.]|nr:LacI family DNA-binding transcriptional regulator [Cohaesibacter sp.]MCV6601135.1 LacI family DNA-binding transcriptional regulator [Cohaesibacter sp.]
MKRLEEEITRQVTALDVAKQAGVSRSAVSRTFTPGASVSDATRKKVLKAADELGYRVNQLARSLINKRSDLVGIVAANMDNPFRAQQVEHMARALVEHGFRPILLPAEGEENPARVIGMLLEYNVSGVIVTSDTPPQGICQECVSLGVPMVLINKGEIDANVDRVLLDNEASGRMAASHLYERSCRNLAVIGSDKPSFSLQVRIRAFRQACRELGFAEPAYFSAPKQDYQAGFLAAQAMIKDMPQVDGLFCVTDYMALGSLDYLRLHSDKKVPDDLKVIGCDDIAQASWAGYNLTTIRQDTKCLAQQVVAALEARFNHPNAPAHLRMVEVNMIERATTKETKDESDQDAKAV